MVVAPLTVLASVSATEPVKVLSSVMAPMVRPVAAVTLFAGVPVNRASLPPRQVRDFPILVIDDEADNASVNTRDQTDRTGEYDPNIDPTRVNGAIRQLLNRSEEHTSELQSL